MGRAGLLDLPYLSIDEPTLHTMVRVWHEVGLAAGLGLGAEGRRLGLLHVRQHELQAAVVVFLVCLPEQGLDM